MGSVPRAPTPLADLRTHTPRQPTAPVRPHPSLTHTLLQEGHTALWVACREGRVDALMALLHAGAQKEAKNKVRKHLCKRTANVHGSWFDADSRPCLQAGVAQLQR